MFDCIIRICFGLLRNGQWLQRVARHVWVSCPLDFFEESPMATTWGTRCLSLMSFASLWNYQWLQCVVWPVGEFCLWGSRYWHFRTLDFCHFIFLYNWFSWADYLFSSGHLLEIHPWIYLQCSFYTLFLLQ